MTPRSFVSTLGAAAAPPGIIPHPSARQGGEPVEIRDYGKAL